MRTVDIKEANRLFRATHVPLLALGIAGAVVCVYSNSFSDAFVLDDYKWIVEDPAIRRLSATWIALCHTARPVLVLSLAFNYWMSGLNVWSYHAFNLAVHLGSTFTLMALVRRTLRLPQLASTFGEDTTVLSAVIALLWAIHPLQTESVTYVIQRSESLMGLFYLLTLFLTIRGAFSPRPGWWYTSSVITCALAVATKPVAVTAPAIVLIYDRLLLVRSWRELLRLRWALYLGFVATWLWLALLLRNAPSAEWSDTAGSARAAGIPTLTYALTQPNVILRYLRLSIWPWPLSLEYDWSLISRVTQAILSLTALTGVVILVAFFSYRQVAALFLGAWFLLILFPTSSFIPISDVIAEHRMYLPLASVIALLVFVGYTGYRRLSNCGGGGRQSARALAVIVIVVVGCALAYTTHRRNADYSTAVTVLSDAVRKHPNNARARINLAALLTNDGRLDEAVDHLQAALAIKPDSAEAYANRGVIEYRRNRPDNAIADYEKSLALNPNDPATHDALGAALLDVGEIEAAIREHQKAVKLKPEFPDARYNLGLALAQTGRVKEAIAQWQKLLELEPGSSRAHKCLAIAALRTGDFDNASHHLELAAAANPTDIDASARLAWLLATSPNARVRNGGRALAISHHANEITKGRDLEVLRALAAAYAETGEFAEASKTARRAIALASQSQNEAEIKLLQSELNSYEHLTAWRDKSAE